MKKNEIFEKHKYMPYFYARKYKDVLAVYNIDFEDFVQILNIELLNLIAHFDENKASFSTFAYKGLGNYSINYFKSSGVKYRLLEAYSEAVSIDHVSMDDYIYCVNALDKVEELSKKQQKILEMHIKGFTNKEIGDTLNISGPAVSMSLKRIKEKV